MADKINENHSLDVAPKDVNENDGGVAKSEDAWQGCLYGDVQGPARRRPFG